MWNFGTRHKHLSPEALSEYVDGRLSPVARRRVDGELARCSACQREQETLWFTSRLLQGLPAVAPRRSFVMASAPVAARVAPARPVLLLRAPQWAYAAAASVALLAFTALASGDIVNSLTPRPAVAPAPNASLSGDGFSALSAPESAPLAGEQAPAGAASDEITALKSGPPSGSSQVNPFPDSTPEPPALSESQREANLRAPAPTTDLPALGADPSAGEETPSGGASPEVTARAAQNGDKLIPATPQDTTTSNGVVGPAGGPGPSEATGPEASEGAAAASQKQQAEIAAAPAPADQSADRDSASALAAGGQPLGAGPDLSFTYDTAPRTPLFVRVLEGVTAALGLAFLVGWAARWRLGKRTGQN